MSIRASCQHRRRRGAAVARLLLVLGAVATASLLHAQQQPFPPPPPPPPPPLAPAADLQQQVPPADVGSGGGLFPGAGSVRRPAGTPAAARAAQRATRRDRFAAPTLSQAATDSLGVRLAYRRAKTAALLDPRFSELLRAADRARGDDERRELLRVYYQDLFARIRRLDRSPALAAHIELLSRAAQQRYAPQRVLGGESEISRAQSTSSAGQRGRR